MFDESSENRHHYHSLSEERGSTSVSANSVQTGSLSVTHEQNSDTISLFEGFYEGAFDQTEVMRDNPSSFFSKAKGCGWKWIQENHNSLILALLCTLSATAIGVLKVTLDKLNGPKDWGVQIGSHHLCLGCELANSALLDQLVPGIYATGPIFPLIFDGLITPSLFRVSDRAQNESPEQAYLILKGLVIGINLLAILVSILGINKVEAVLDTLNNLSKKKGSVLFENYPLENVLTLLSNLTQEMGTQILDRNQIEDVLRSANDQISKNSPETFDGNKIEDFFDKLLVGGGQKFFKQRQLELSLILVICTLRALVSIGTLPWTIQRLRNYKEKKRNIKLREDLSIAGSEETPSETGTYWILDQSSLSP